MYRCKPIKHILPVALVLLLSFLCIDCSAPDDTATETAKPTPATTTTVPTTATTPETTTVFPTTPADESGQSFIWKITSADTYVYLLGSVHVADADTYPLAGIIENAFAESDILVVEVNINEVDVLESAALILEYATYPSGERLQEILPEDLYEELDERLAEWGISLAILDSYRPWFIANILDVTSLQEMGYTADYGIDMHFLEAGEVKNLEIVELETEEFQIKLLADVPDDVMIKMMEMNLDEPDTGEDIEELLEIWENGDSAAMEELLFEGLYEEPELLPYFEALFTNRNYMMLEKIEGFLESDEIYFIVVGAGHLVGEEGLLNLLEEAGYVVEQLEN